LYKQLNDMAVLSANKIKFIRSLSQKKFREEHGLFIAEGEKIVQEALNSGYNVKEVFYEKEIGRETMERITCLNSPSPVLAVIEKPDFTPDSILQSISSMENSSGRKPLYLALDGVKDPGNLGTILRTADAFDIPVVLLEGCADPYSHKVVRSSMGAVLRTQPVKATWQQVSAACRAAGVSIGVTALDERAKDIRQADVSQMAMVIGSEGQGVRKEILAEADHSLIIPMNPRCESLNAAVAATVVMWQMQ
jgi:TrmH family RNA methyltransferase